MSREHLSAPPRQVRFPVGITGIGLRLALVERSSTVTDHLQGGYAAEIGWISGQQNSPVDA